MGANAQTTVPTFTAGQVLTAAQMNNSARTGVPVFADTSARDAAFGGTGEKTLAEGQLCYLEDADVVQYYDGSSWATVGPSAAAGLELVSTTTIGTSVASVTVSNAFSATYDNYRVVISGGVATANAGMEIQFGATTAGYYSSYFRALWGGTTSVVSRSNLSSGSFCVATPNFIHTSVDVLAPNLAKTTVWSGTFVEVNTTLAATFVGGYLNDTNQYTDFTIAGATMTGGTIRVYGYKN